MTAVQPFPPDAETLAYSASRVPDMRWTPGAVGCLDGPGNLGPEHAGALSLVYSSFVDPAKAQRAYRRFADAQHAASQAEGFLRWFTIIDGAHGYGLGLWRDSADAAAFARSPFHRDVVREQRADCLEYSQFAGIWSAHAVGRRNFYCPVCATVTAAPAASCGHCGEPLDDGFGG
ncbi:MAG TPA: hypothetical protein VHB69_08560 [Mycobacteriales bacterium]|nr:hypothetical protein [Mycobacteriales bacterium]